MSRLLVAEPYQHHPGGKTIVNLPLAANADTVTPSTGVSVAGHQGATIHVACGVVTDGTHAIEVQESDIATTGFTAVADADLVGSEPTLTSGNDVRGFLVGYKGTKNYVRVVSGVTGATTGGIYGGYVVLGLRADLVDPTQPSS